MFSSFKARWNCGPIKFSSTWSKNVLCHGCLLRNILKIFRIIFLWITYTRLLLCHLNLLLYFFSNLSRFSMFYHCFYCCLWTCYCLLGKFYSRILREYSTLWRNLRTACGAITKKTKRNSNCLYLICPYLIRSRCSRYCFLTLYVLCIVYSEGLENQQKIDSNY